MSVDPLVAFDDEQALLDFHVWTLRELLDSLETQDRRPIPAEVKRASENAA